MNPNLLTLMQSQGGPLLIKTGFVVILLLMEIFLLVLHKQIRSMNAIVTQPDMFPYLQSFTILLEIITVVLILVTLVIL